MATEEGRVLAAKLNNRRKTKKVHRGPKKSTKGQQPRPEQDNKRLKSNRRRGGRRGKTQPSKSQRSITEPRCCPKASRGAADGGKLQSRRTNDPMGPNDESIHRVMLYQDPATFASGATYEVGSREDGRSATGGGFNTHRSDDTRGAGAGESAEGGYRAGRVSHHDGVMVLSQPTRGFGADCGGEVREQSHDPDGVGISEVGPVRKEDDHKIHSSAGGIPIKFYSGCSEPGPVQRGIEGHAEIEEGSDSAFLPKWSGEVPGHPWVYSSGDCGTYRSFGWEPGLLECATVRGESCLHRGGENTGQVEHRALEGNTINWIHPIYLDSNIRENLSENQEELLPNSDPYYWNEEQLLKIHPEIRRGRHLPCHLPLDFISTNRIDLARVKRLGNTNDHETLKWITTDIARRYIAGITEKLAVSRLPCDEVLNLESSGVVDFAPGHSNHAVRLFKVPKKGGKARLIVDCRTINEAMPRPGPMGLEGYHTVMDGIVGCEAFWQCDARNYFYQIPLEGGAENLFPVRLGGARGKFQQGYVRVLPMGWSYAPMIAQCISNILLREVKKVAAVYAVAWIDNYLFAGTWGEVKKAREHFVALCKYVNMELKEYGDSVSEGEFLGVHINCRTKKISNTPDNLLKLEELTASLTEAKSCREWASTVGKGLWTNYAIGRKPLCLYTEVLQGLSTLGKWIFEHRDLKEVWNLHVPETVHRYNYYLKEMLDKAKEVTFSIQPEWDGTPEYAWTDASADGAGVWYERKESVTGWSYRNVGNGNIYFKELAVALEALVSLENGDHTTVLVTDNKGVYHTLRKGHSRSVAGNLILRKAIECTRFRQWYVAWVPTEAQRADGLSRGIAKPVGNVANIVPKPEKVIWF